jgi:polyisoprenoid-binding protein YceI
MRHSTLGLVLIAFLAAAPVVHAADKYKIDPEHSSVIFRINHLDIADIYGRFNDPTGVVVLDSSDPSKSSFTFEVQAANIDTHNEKRDAHLRSPDFFDAKQFPVITFKSTSVKGSGNDYEVTGDLTMHGVTKQITVPITRTGEGKDPWGGYRTGWKATADLKRSDFGIKGVAGVGDEVHLIISFEAVKA